jgi:hypothetical protein
MGGQVAGVKRARSGIALPPFLPPPIYLGGGEGGLGLGARKGIIFASRVLDRPPLLLWAGRKDQRGY